MSIEKYAPTFAEKRDVVVQILNDVFVKTLWQSDYTKENGIGASNPEKWQALIDESKEIGNIDETFDAFTHRQNKEFSPLRTGRAMR